MAAANPARPEAEPPGDVMSAAVLLDMIDDRSGAMTHKHDSQDQGTPNATRSVRRNWAAAFAAGFAVVLIVGVSIVLLASGGDSLDTVAPVTTTAAVAATAIAPSTVDVAPEAWNPILTTTTAKPAPAAATCPAGSDPDAAGRVDQERPYPGWPGNLAGVFDTHAGRIVYVDGVGETWTFDVCTNTWQEMNPTERPANMRGYSAMVYDVDSDVTVAFAGGRTWAYDANSNTWTEGRTERPDWDFSLGAVYDPVSGLIITSNPSLTEAADPDRWDLWAYNVDTDEWTLLGPVPIDRTTPCCTQIDLLGYSPKLDRLILVTPSEYSTVLIDPRSGETTLVATDSPIVDLIWPSHVYGPADDTVYVYEGIYRSAGGPYAFAACGFDAGTLTWPCVVSPSDPPDRHRWLATIVEDSINERLLFINSSVVVFSSEGVDDTDDVWAIDLDTGEWTQLLAPSSP